MRAANGQREQGFGVRLPVQVEAFPAGDYHPMVRWYLRYKLSYEYLPEVQAERSIALGQEHDLPLRATL